MNKKITAILASLVLVLGARGAAADEALLADGTRLAGKLMCRAENGTVAFQTNAGPLRILAPEEVRDLRADDASRPAYIRFSTYRPSYSRLEVLARTFRSADGARTVTLAGAVHVADLFFYRQAQRVLDAHDLVLFEGVGATSDADLATLALPAAEARAAELKRPFTRRQIRRSEVSSLDLLTSLQLRMGESLDLVFQIEGVDYSHSWWVSADVTAEELGEIFANRRGSILSDLFSAESLRTQAAANEIIVRALADVGKSLFTGKPVAIVWKETFAQLLASQMESGAPPDSPGEPVMQEVLITSRNKVVMRKLGEALRNPAARSIAIFYGAGHDPDLERRIVAEGFRPVRDEWLPAWEIRSPVAGAAPAAPRREPKLY